MRRSSSSLLVALYYHNLFSSSSFFSCRGFSSFSSSCRTAPRTTTTISSIPPRQQNSMMMSPFSPTKRRRRKSWNGKQLIETRRVIIRGTAARTRRTTRTTASFLMLCQQQDDIDEDNSADDDEDLEDRIEDNIDSKGKNKNYGSSSEDWRTTTTNDDIDTGTTTTAAATSTPSSSKKGSSPQKKRITEILLSFLSDVSDGASVVNDHFLTWIGAVYGLLFVTLGFVFRVLVPILMMASGLFQRLFAGFSSSSPSLVGAAVVAMTTQQQKEQRLRRSMYVVLSNLAAISKFYYLYPLQFVFAVFLMLLAPNRKCSVNIRHNGGGGVWKAATTSLSLRRMSWCFFLCPIIEEIVFRFLIHKAWVRLFPMTSGNGDGEKNKSKQREGISDPTKKKTTAATTMWWERLLVILLRTTKKKSSSSFASDSKPVPTTTCGDRNTDDDTVTGTTKNDYWMIVSAFCFCAAHLNNFFPIVDEDMDLYRDRRDDRFLVATALHEAGENGNHGGLSFMKKLLWRICFPTPGGTVGGDGVGASSASRDYYLIDSILISSLYQLTHCFISTMILYGPLFKRRGLGASIGAHIAWNANAFLLVANVRIRILFRLFLKPLQQRFF